MKKKKVHTNEIAALSVRCLQQAVLTEPNYSASIRKPINCKVIVNYDRCVAFRQDVQS